MEDFDPCESRRPQAYTELRTLHYREHFIQPQAPSSWTWGSNQAGTKAKMELEAAYQGNVYPNPLHKFPGKDFYWLKAFEEISVQQLADN